MCSKMSRSPLGCMTRSGFWCSVRHSARAVGSSQGTSCGAATADYEMGKTMTVPLSVLIPTKNEEKNIHKCLESVSWADEVYIVDSCSTDRTAEIAQSRGATVVPFSWDGKGPRKKNWALDHLPWKHPWILVVDADEEVTPALRDEIAAVVIRPSTYAAFLIPYHYYFLGRLLRHGAPLWKLI